MRLIWLVLGTGRQKNHELGIVLTILGIIVLLPTLATIIVAGLGLSAVSSALAAANPVTHEVTIYAPNGDVVVQLSAATLWPVQGIVTTEFGVPDLPYQLHHTGIDIADKIGDPVTTFMGGIVVTVETNPNNATGYGKYVMLDHGNSIVSLYGHLSITLATVGQIVMPGDIIGLEGNTGHATGPHVHFEVRVAGIPVNPRLFMIGDPVRL